MKDKVKKLRAAGKSLREISEQLNIKRVDVEKALVDVVYISPEPSKISDERIKVKEANNKARVVKRAKNAAITSEKKATKTASSKKGK